MGDNNRKADPNHQRSRSEVKQRVYNRMISNDELALLQASKAIVRLLEAKKKGTVKKAVVKASVKDKIRFEMK